MEKIESSSSSNPFLPVATEGYFEDSNQKGLHQVAEPNMPSAIDNRFKKGVGYRVFEWIAAHPVESQQAISPVVDKIRRVSHQRFVHSLGASIDSIMLQLKELYKRDFLPHEDAIVLVEGRKSNKWVAELAYMKGQFVPKHYYHLGTKDAVDFAKFFESLPKKEEANFRKAFEGKTLVLFDDGSYSGKQMTDHLIAIRKIIDKNKLLVKAIAVVVPFMTSYAEQLISDLNSESPKRSSSKKKASSVPILIAQHQRIPTLGDLPAQDHQKIAKMWYQGSAADFPKIGLIWFDHKIPNDQSFPGPIIRGSVYDMNGKSVKNNGIQFIPEIISPYKR